MSITFSQSRIKNNDKKFDSKYLKVSYWCTILPFDEAIEVTKIMRKFTDYLDRKIEKLISKGFNPETIEQTLSKIEEQIITRKFKKVSDLPGFTFSNRCYDYWLFRGWSKEEAKEKITVYQSNNGKKRAVKIQKLKKENPKKLKEQFNTNIEYYLAKGMTQEEAEEALKDRQSTFSKKKLIEKHGEKKGLEILEKRNKQWISTLKENNDWDELSKKKATTLEKFIEKYGEEEGTIKWNLFKENNIVRITKASKESLNLLYPIYNTLIERGFDKHDLYLGIDNSNEWFISTKEHFYIYDFTIRSKKLIIEYHGIAFHPKEGEIDWISAYGVSYEEAINKDKLKRKLAESKGFKILEIWSDEINQKEKALKFIEENL